MCQHWIKGYSEASRLSAVYTSSNYTHARYSYVVSDGQLDWILDYHNGVNSIAVFILLNHAVVDVVILLSLYYFIAVFHLN